MYKALIIGGSAGSFQGITKLLSSLPENFYLPVLLNLHRLKHVRSGFIEALTYKSKIPIVEPDDKDQIKKSIGYLAPANYHMYVELGNRIALSTEEAVNHSRPSIDLSFISGAEVYAEKLIAILLSGANKDGALGMKRIKQAGGLTIVQDPKDCQVPTMPEAAINETKVDYIYSLDRIISFLRTI